MVKISTFVFFSKEFAAKTDFSLGKVWPSLTHQFPEGGKYAPMRKRTLFVFIPCEILCFSQEEKQGNVLALTTHFWKGKLIIGSENQMFDFQNLIGSFSPIFTHRVLLIFQDFEFAQNLVGLTSCAWNLMSMVSRIYLFQILKTIL